MTGLQQYTSPARRSFKAGPGAAGVAWRHRHRAESRPGAGGLSRRRDVEPFAVAARRYRGGVDVESDHYAEMRDLARIGGNGGTPAATLTDRPVGKDTQWRHNQPGRAPNNATRPKRI
jgi:hypothetical protein